jgi:octaprenyl-diphosphate synthase
MCFYIKNSKVYNTLKHVYDYVSPDLKQVEQLIKKSVEQRDATINLITDYLITAGGKKLRPLFAILSAKLFEYEGNNHIKIATAVEFIHSATLLHDDVVDESKLRRGKLTAHQKWGNKSSILVGDFLFSQAFVLMVDTKSIEVLEVLSLAAGIISEGEVMQLNVINNLELSKEKYIHIISSKTAELFAASCKAGAIIANQPNHIIQAMYEFGMNVGIAFQIIDDLLDYNANVDDLGKNIGDDFYEGKVTLPVIITYNKAAIEEKEQIKHMFKHPKKNIKEFIQLKKLMQKYEAYNSSIGLASEYISKCHLILDTLPINQINSMFKEILESQIKRVC